jgi:hypothetical protein
MLAAAPSLAQKSESDAQGLMIVKQTIDAVGGLDLLSSVRDFKGAGTITYHWAEEVQGTVEMKGKGRSSFRLDASLPSGVRSTIVHGGRGFLKQPDNITFIPDPSHMVVSPHLALLEALRARSSSVQYVGLVKHHGRLRHDIRVSETRLGIIGPFDRLKVDYFIDPKTFLIVGMREPMPRTPLLARQWHEFDFDDYRRIGGALIPFSIKETVHEQLLLSITLTDFVLNANITTDDFEP